MHICQYYFVKKLTQKVFEVAYTITIRHETRKELT